MLLGNLSKSKNLLAKMISPVNSPGSPGIPQGLTLPDIIITRRTRTHSMNGRIEEDVHEGTVRFFCRSKGHGFIDDDTAAAIVEAKVRSILILHIFIEYFYY
jgi:hypothetical protein